MYSSLFLIRPYLDDPENIRVRCGEWDLHSEQEWYLIQDRKVDSFTMHPRFIGGKKLYNDIALIHVSKDFDLANDQTEQHLNVAPICLPPFKEANVNENECFSMGWGKKEFNAESYEETMKQVHVPLFKNPECQKALRATPRLPDSFRLHPGFVCAGGIKGEDTCEGDGGGPLVCESKDDPSR